MGKRKDNHKKYKVQWDSLDFSVLMILHQQRAIRLDHLPRFLVQLQGKPKQEAAHLRSTSHNLVERLQRAGLIHLQRFGNQPDWIWLTQQGMRRIGIFRRIKTPARSMLHAVHATNTIRLLLTEDDPHAFWISQEQIRSMVPPLQRHALPHAELRTGRGKHIAIHIALRLTETDEQLTTRLQQQLEQEAKPGRPFYTELWYYAADGPAKRLRAVRARIAESSKEAARRLCIFSYPYIDKHVLYRHNAPVRALAWSVDGQWLASADEENRLHVWDAATGQDRFRCLLPASPCLLRWSMTSAWIALGDEEGRVSWWDGTTGARHETCLVREKERIIGLACSPLHDNLTAFCSSNGRFGVYDVHQQKRQWETQRSMQQVGVLAWSPDGMCLAMGGTDTFVRLFAAATGKQVHAYKKHPTTVAALTWSPDSTLLASASNDSTIQIWNATTGKKQRVIVSALKAVSVLAWSPDGTRLACAGSASSVQIWQITSGRLLYTYEDHADEITNLVWSPDGTLLASASNDSTVHVYPVPGVPQFSRATK